MYLLAACISDCTERRVLLFSFPTSQHVLACRAHQRAALRPRNAARALISGNTDSTRTERIPVAAGCGVIPGAGGWHVAQFGGGHNGRTADMHASG